MSLEDELFAQRGAALTKIRALGFRPYGHRFDFSHTLEKVLELYSSSSHDELEQGRVNVVHAAHIAELLQAIGGEHAVGGRVAYGWMPRD